jgi:predicted TIM-barrel fold metal-dependent hydrolase
MAELAFFDANCQVGLYNFRVEGGPYSLQELVADTRKHDISQRLVYSAMAKEHSPALGNERLMQEIAGREELEPCWACSTWVTGEMPEPQQFVQALQQAKVKAVRFFRHFYHVPMSEWSLGPLWRELERYRIPLFLDLGERWATMDEIDADEVYELCHAHPGLPVILTKHRIRFNRQVYALLEACPNLHLELSGYWHYRAVEDICRRFGSERLLFGTNWPFMDSAFAIAAVTYAEVSRGAKEAVAGRNLRSLLEAVPW